MGRENIEKKMKKKRYSRLTVRRNEIGKIKKPTGKIKKIQYKGKNDYLIITDDKRGRKRCGKWRGSEIKASWQMARCPPLRHTELQ